MVLRSSHMSGGTGSDSYPSDRKSTLKKPPQQLKLDSSVMILPAMVTPSGCWGLVCLQRSECVLTCACVCLCLCAHTGGCVKACATGLKKSPWVSDWILLHCNLQFLIVFIWVNWSYSCYDAGCGWAHPSGRPAAPAAASKQMSERVPTLLAKLLKPPAGLEASMALLSKRLYSLHHCLAPPDTHPNPPFRSKYRVCYY